MERTSSVSDRTIDDGECFPWSYCELWRRTEFLNAPCIEFVNGNNLVASIKPTPLPAY